MVTDYLAGEPEAPAPDSLHIVTFTDPTRPSFVVPGSLLRDTIVSIDASGVLCYRWLDDTVQMAALDKFGDYLNLSTSAFSRVRG